MVHPAFGITDGVRRAEREVQRLTVTEMRNRVFSTFAHIKAEVDELVTRYRADLGPEEVPWYIYGDGEIGDEAEDAGVERHLELEYVFQEVVNVAVVGLYHAWEKPVRRLIRNQAPSLDLLPKQIRELEKGGFEELCDIITAVGWIIREEPFFGMLNQLRLAANVIKHDSAEAAHDLYAANHYLFHNSVWPELYSVDKPFKVKPGDLALSADHYEEFAEAIDAFWAGYPRRCALTA